MDGLEAVLLELADHDSRGVDDQRVGVLGGAEDEVHSQANGVEFAGACGGRTAAFAGGIGSPIAAVRPRTRNARDAASVCRATARRRVITSQSADAAEWYLRYAAMRYGLLSFQPEVQAALRTELQAVCARLNERQKVR